jgi:hypothetical protein
MQINNAFSNVTVLRRSKRLLYGDMLRQNSIAWRVLGYPVHELESVIFQFQESIKNLVWNHLYTVHDFATSLTGLTPSGNWEKVFIIFRVNMISIIANGHFIRSYNYNHGSN